MKKPFIDREKIHKWMKRTTLVSAVLFIIALVGMLVGSSIPTQVEQELTLLAYEHNGRFDYLVYLKPSFLFGPEPQEEPLPPPDRYYPTVLLEDVIDMSFRFETDLPLLNQIEQGVKVEAILQNSDIWQKKIELVPVTNKTGNFKVEFQLDMAEIHDIYDEIDEEIQIQSGTREVILRATVGLGEGLESATLIQELPIKLSSSVIEIGGERVKMVLDSTGRVEARGTFDYTLHLKENSVYSGDTLTLPPVLPYVPPQLKTLGVGPVIPYELVERMDASYHYQLLASRPLTDVTQEVTITATLGDPELWTKTFVLMPSTRQADSFTADFPLDIVYLNEMLGIIREETGTGGEGFGLTIEAFVNVSAESEIGPINETFVQTLSTDIGGGILSWKEELELAESHARLKKQTLKAWKKTPDRSAAHGSVRSW